MTDVIVLFTHKKSGLFATFILLALLVASIPAARADPGFTLEDVTTWYWVTSTRIESVAVADVDGDLAVEIVTGGYYYDGTRDVAQLCVWDGGTLQGVKTWYWTSHTIINSVACADVDGDGQTEIVTGGAYWDGTRNRAQLCVWDGSTMTLEGVRIWYSGDGSVIYSVAVGDVDGDGSVEIVAGGKYYDGTRDRAQLLVWTGSSLALEGFKAWYWTSHTQILSVAVGDVDGDAQVEIVTGGLHHDGTLYRAQLCVWDGATLALEDVTTWYWTSHTQIFTVAVGDVDGDLAVEIVTGGRYNDGTRLVAQLCVWTGSSLAFEAVTTWYWGDDTYLESVAVGDVDGDGETEIVTGGDYWDGSREVAQLAVWKGAPLSLEGVKTWYWGDDTEIFSVAVGDVDGDGQVEIVTGGEYDDGTRHRAQLCVWGFT